MCRDGDGDFDATVWVHAELPHDKPEWNEKPQAGHVYVLLQEV